MKRNLTGDELRAEWRGLRRARRMYPTVNMHCQKCGVSGVDSPLQRHHRNRNHLDNRPANITLLCGPCHAALHIRAGEWGRRRAA